MLTLYISIDLFHSTRFIESDGVSNFTSNLNANGSANIQVEVNSDDNGSCRSYWNCRFEVNDSPAFTKPILRLC